MLDSAFHATHLFEKHERLCSLKAIDLLFKSNHQFFLFPFKVKYLAIESEVKAHQILITIPKKNFKRAVDRNYLKRRIREAYRLEKNSLKAGSEGTFFMIAFIYVAKEKLSYAEILQRMKQIIARFNQLHSA